MANHSNNFDGQILIDDGNGTAAAPGGYFGFGRNGTASTGPRWYSIASNPDGVLTAPKGSLASDRTNGGLYINTDGATNWVAISGSGGQIGPLPDDVYLVMGTDSDGEIGYNSGIDGVVLESLTRSGGAINSAGVLIRSGTSAASGTGAILLITGAAAAAASGSIGISTGTAVNSASGQITVKSGFTIGANSGTVELGSGVSSLITGTVYVRSSGGGTGSGPVIVGTGSTQSGTTGSVQISTGSGGAGNASTGDVEISTGIPDGSGTKGSIICTDGKQIVPPIPTVGTTAVTATLATPAMFVLDVADIATGTAVYQLTYPIEIVEVVVRKTGAVGDASNTIQLLSGATPLTDVIPQPVAAGTLQRNNSAAVLTTSTAPSLTVAVVRAGGSSACRIYVTGVRR